MPVDGFRGSCYLSGMSHVDCQCCFANLSFDKDVAYAGDSCCVNIFMEEHEEDSKQRYLSTEEIERSNIHHQLWS